MITHLHKNNRTYSCPNNCKLGKPDDVSHVGEILFAIAFWLVLWGTWSLSLMQNCK